MADRPGTTNSRRGYFRTRDRAAAARGRVMEDKLFDCYEDSDRFTPVEHDGWTCDKKQETIAVS